MGKGEHVFRSKMRPFLGLLQIRDISVKNLRIQDIE